MKQLRSTVRDLQDLLERRLTVRVIAEFDLKAATPDRDGFVLLKEMREADFDIVPVRGEGKVLGYAIRDELRDGPCGNQMRLFRSEDFIAESTPLLEVLRLLRDRAWLFVIDRNDVAGIVTRGDLRKAPIRMFLFVIVNLLEMHLNRLIRQQWPNDGWPHLLIPKRIEAAESRQKSRKDLNEDLDLVDCLQLCDKRDIVTATPALVDAVGLSTPEAAHDALFNVEALRNRIAHAQDLIEGSSWKDLFDIADQTEQMLRRCEESALG